MGRGKSFIQVINPSSDEGENRMNYEVVLTCAVTGAGDTTQKNPHVPVTPEEIANAAIEAAKAGASAAHIHVRDPKTGRGSRDVELFREPVDRIRSPYLRQMAATVQKLGVKPELEVFELGQIRFAKQMIAEGLIDEPPMFQICLGIPWGAEQSVDNMKVMKDELPANASWASFGISRMQMPMAAAAVAMGGNVRVGLEDNIYLDRGVLATNAQLVTRAREIIERMGGRILTPAEARDKLGLRKP